MQIPTVTCIVLKEAIIDGENYPFNQETYDKCGDDYYNEFIEACTSVNGNTMEGCESSTDA